MVLLSKKQWWSAVAAYAVTSSSSTHALSNSNNAGVSTRRAALGWMAGGVIGWTVNEQASRAEDAVRLPPDSFNVDAYLKSGQVMNPMGVSGQAGKSKPETGVLVRAGSEVSRDSRTGDVLAEILLQSSNSDEKVPVLASFVSPWPLATGTVYDVECRNAKTGDGSFLAVTPSTGGKSLSDLKDSFFVEELIKPTGRFSFYGPPTDVKVKGSSSNGAYRIIDFSFSTLSQSTNTEIPRRARIVATIPEGTKQAVMLIGSSSAPRWNKGSKETIAEVAEGFRATAAPTSALRMRAKERRSS